MMDFAQIKTISQNTAKVEEKTLARTRSITISLSSLALTIIFSLLIYFTGYQNMVIEQMKHEINNKKSTLNSLILEKQNLVKKQTMLINPESILNNSKVATSNNIEIVR